jgi:hypothetical protein
VFSAAAATSVRVAPAARGGRGRLVARAGAAVAVTCPCTDYKFF